MKETVLCDSFVFIEIYGGSRKADKIIAYLKNKRITISSITLFEIYKKYLRVRPGVAEEILDETIVNAEKIIDPDKDLLIRAAQLAAKYKALSMANAIILATAEIEGVVLYTGDPDFWREPIDEVRVRKIAS